MEIKDDKFYGKRFKTFRVNANKSQKEVSNYLGVTQSALSKYESGKLQPSFDILIKMGELYKVPLDVLLGAKTRKEFLIYMHLDDSLKEQYKNSEKNGVSYKEIKDIIKVYFKKNSR